MTAFLALCTALAFLAMGHFMLVRKAGDAWDGAALILSDTATKPIAYRMLVPSTVRTIVRLTPPSWQQAVAQKVRQASAENACIRYVVQPATRDLADDRLLYGYCVMHLVIFLSLLGSVIMIYVLAAQVLCDRFSRCLAPVLLLLAMPALNHTQTLNYDYAVVLLMTAGLYCLAHQRWLPFVVVFALATFNRETSIYLTFVFALHFARRLSLRPFALLLIGQMLLYLVIQLAIRSHYQHAPGTGLNWTFHLHLRQWLAGYRGTFYIALLSLLYLLSARWTEKPVFLRHALWICLPTLVGYVMVGIPREYRQLYECLPVCILALTHTLVASSGLARWPVASPEPALPPGKRATGRSLSGRK